MGDPHMTPDQLLEAWHDQQTAFIEFREMRTRTMVRVLAHLQSGLDHPIRVLDLACGPASLATEVLAAIPGASAVGVDRDPILLRLAKETNQFGERLQIVDADITDPTLPEQLGGRIFDAAISATALHWLDPGELVSLYQHLPRMLVDGGVFLNADHLYYDQRTQAGLDALAVSLRDSFQVNHMEQGAMSWDDWWQAATTMPGWEKDAQRRQQVWANDHPTVKVSTGFHLAALQAAGFIETDQIYQWFDDRIIFGRLA
ncbi:hypothetical protein HMPREF1531_00458 [Propionibacterium sp. oral taxon 192 str. F0372]|uniref:class I SAM-dependent methyltransferase n=1 Tax=Propionibacterium sp. oral taxon 192 TaxID=671222 RepID=UPI0003541C68|nr:class I SAM-dependent methyltransferase [Propionibacterium sp. oral taxon 192]EPH06856.1 hypothetical protein HMPREF1531_00458 [Propionibacterium sp. oral taxon 192 str. F0372]